MAFLWLQNEHLKSFSTFSKEERSLNRNFKKKIGGASVDNELDRDFTMGELKKALRKMKRKGAQGPDEIPPTFLKELGPKAIEELFSIYNICFKTD